MQVEVQTLERASSDEIRKKLKEILDAPVKPFPAFSGDQKRAYDSIVDQLKPYGLTDPRASVYPPHPPSILENAKRPEAIPAEAWDPVIRQLRAEFIYRQSCHQFFRLFDSFLGFVYVSNLSYLNQAVQLAQATRDEEGQFVFKALINVGLAAIGSLEIPFVGVAVALFQVMLDVAESDGEISSGTVAGTISKLHSQLEKDFKGCRTSIRKMEVSILDRWSSLEPMGRSLLAGEIQWPKDETRMIDAALRTYKVSLWQILLPAVWYIMRPQNDPTFFHGSADWIDGYIKANPNYYLSATPSGRGHVVAFRWLGRGMFPLGHQQPGREMCGEIFDTLRIPRQDVFTEKNGWKGFEKQTLTECSGTHVAALMTAAEHPNGPPTDHLERLRKLREELRKSPMGSWYMRVYDEVAPEILKLYETDRDRAIARAIDRYRGRAIYDALIRTLGGSGSVSSEQQDDLVGILTVVIDTSVRLLGPQNIVQRRTDTMLPRLWRYAGKTFSQVLATIAAETPPATEEDAQTPAHPEQS